MVNVKKSKTLRARRIPDKPPFEKTAPCNLVNAKAFRLDPARAAGTCFKILFVGTILHGEREMKLQKSLEKVVTTRPKFDYLAQKAISNRNKVVTARPEFDYLAQKAISDCNKVVTARRKFDCPARPPRFPTLQLF